MSIITADIDLAKKVFAVHDVDENGKAALVKHRISLVTSNENTRSGPMQLGGQVG